MRYVLLVFFAFLNLASAYGQFSNGQLIYFSGEVGGGNYSGIDVGLNYIVKGKYSFQLSYSNYQRPAKSRPDDYSSGLFQSSAKDKVEAIHLMVGRVLLLNQKGNIKLNLKGGIGYAIIREPTNWFSDGGSWISANNYTFDYTENRGVSFIFRPRVEFNFTRHYGMSVSPLVQVNKETVVFGLGIGHNVGILKKKK